MNISCEDICSNWGRRGFCERCGGGVLFLPKDKKGDARVSQCENCKCAPVCAIKKGLENEMEKLKNIMPEDIREVAEITVKCKYFIQDKDPNIPDRFQ